MDEILIDQSQLSDISPRPPKRWHWKRILALALIIMLVIIVIYVGYLISIAVKISTNPAGLGGLSADGSGRTNVLVLGQGDPGHAGEGLTDTMMLISYDASSHQLAEVSIPRDLRVKIPGYGYGKVNSANALGGPTLAAQTVSNTLNVPINYIVQTDFSGLSKVVDSVGGLDVHVTSELSDPEYPCADNQYAACGIDIKPGLQHMDGATVLEYVRCRKGTCGNDFGRAERQQEVIGLLKAKILTAGVLLNPVKLAAVVNAVRAGVTTTMSAQQLAQFALDFQRASKHPTRRLVLSTQTGGYLVNASGSSDLLPADGSFAAIDERVAHIFTDPVQQSDLPIH